MKLDLGDQKHRYLVTGGAGFLGSFVVEELRARGVQPSQILVPRSAKYDLTSICHCEALFLDVRPTIVIHLAATVGGIGANRREPGRFMYENLQMGLNVMETAREFGATKLVQVGTVCSYPKLAPTPFREEAFWNGYPEETNAPYGIAKKALLVLGKAYRQQYGLNSICLIPSNLYGPRDCFDPGRSHVIPALIHKFVEAKKIDDPPVKVWGTGRATRDFLYVADAAKGVVDALETYDGSEPVNLGTGCETTILELAKRIARELEYRGQIVTDANQPDGQPRRSVSANRAKELFEWEATTSLEEGLRATINWYVASINEGRS